MPDFPGRNGDRQIFVQRIRTSKKGTKITAKVSGKKFERLSIVAAQCGEKVLAPFEYHGTCDAKLFNFWLDVSSQIVGRGNMS